MVEVWVWVVVGLMFCNEVMGGLFRGGFRLMMFFLISGFFCVSVLLGKLLVIRFVDKNIIFILRMNKVYINYV